MRLKEEKGIKMEELPIKKKLRRAEHIVASLLKKAVMAKLLNYH
jgi:hypothetical protein